jgi:hypothetical protein
MNRFYFLIFMLLSANLLLAQSTSLQGIAVDMNLPAGWQVMQEQYGLALIGHQTTPGFIMISEHGWKDPQEVSNNVKEGIQEEGTQLAIMGSSEPLQGKTIGAAFQGYSNGSMVKAYGAATLSDYWQMGGVIVLAMVRSDLYNEEYKTLVQSIAASIRYRPFMDAQAQQWALLVKGKSLYKSSNNYDNTDYTTDGGDYAGYSTISFSSSSQVDLCSDGRYFFSSKSSSSIDVSMAGMNDSNQSTSSDGGYWSLMNINNTPVFRLLSNDGTVTYYAVEEYDESGYLYIQGERWAIGNSDRCH